MNFGNESEKIMGESWQYPNACTIPTTLSKSQCELFGMDKFVCIAIHEDIRM